jgi:hypothetical protein
MGDTPDSLAADLAALQRRLVRERRARLQAESIAEEALRDAYEKHQNLLRATAEREGLVQAHEANIRSEQLRVVHVTMRTVQDIVNNALTQLQLLRMDAEDHVAQETLTLFDQAIDETSSKLKALGDLGAFAEKQMAVGMGLDVGKTTG